MRSVGDAATFAESLPTGGVHCLITDPPWAMYEGVKMNQNLADTSVLRGSQLFKKTAPYALVTIPEITRHLRLIRERMAPGAHAYIFLPSGEYFEPALRSLIDDGWRFLRLLTWIKAPHGGGGLGKTWMGGFEPIAILSNGDPRPYPSLPRRWPTVFKQRPQKTRTSKPPQLYQVFLEASTRPGELAVDPYCGLDPLATAATACGRAWRSNDVLTPEEVAAQARDR